MIFQDLCNNGNAILIGDSRRYREYYWGLLLTIVIERNAKFKVEARENEDVMPSRIKFTDPVNFTLESQLKSPSPGQSKGYWSRLSQRHYQVSCSMSLKKKKQLIASLQLNQKLHIKVFITNRHKTSYAICSCHPVKSQVSALGHTSKHVGWKAHWV